MMEVAAAEKISLSQAQAVHQKGDFAQAEQLYRALLQQRPNDADALHFLGLLQFQCAQQTQGIELVRQSLQQAPDNPHAWNNLGNMLVALDQPEAAVEVYERATQLAPDLVQAWYNLGICFRRTKKIENAVAAFCKAIDLQPADTIVYERFGMLLYGLGRFKQAADIYRQWLAREPNSAVARHMLAAMTGEAVPDRATDTYVKQLFDRFAQSFDEQLTALGYRAPELLAAALGEYVRSDGALTILDAGCGTGWCGGLVRSMARHLVGVDLSAGMIEKAQARNVYDALEVAELCAFLHTSQQQFDVILSADTLVYFGSLHDFFAAAQPRLRPQGILAFTLEQLDMADEQADFALKPHGRYAHAGSYVQASLQAAGFTVLACRDVVLRQERCQDVLGFLVVAQVADV